MLEGGGGGNHFFHFHFRFQLACFPIIWLTYPTTHVQFDCHQDGIHISCCIWDPSHWKTRKRRHNTSLQTLHIHPTPIIFQPQGGKKTIFWLPYAVTFKLATEVQSALCHMAASTRAKNIPFLNSSIVHKLHKLRVTFQGGILLGKPYARIKLNCCLFPL